MVSPSLLDYDEKSNYPILQMVKQLDYIRAIGKAVWVDTSRMRPGLYGSLIL